MGRIIIKYYSLGPIVLWVVLISVLLSNSLHTVVLHSGTEFGTQIYLVCQAGDYTSIRKDTSSGKESHFHQPIMY
jgi:hypothetical protein